MQRFKSILVVIDRNTDSEVLVKRAVTLAHRNQAHLNVITFSEELPPDTPAPFARDPTDVGEPGINIIEELSPDIPAPITPESDYDLELINDTQIAISPEAGMPTPGGSHMAIQEKITEANGIYLENIIASIRQAEVQVSGKVLYGTPFLEIIREVLRKEHDLVMIAAGSRSGLKEMLFGSTIMHMMRKCPCPVWVVKPDQPKHYNRILAAVDPTPHDEVRSTLNAKIMELATSLARWEGSELIVIHAWIVGDESFLRSGRVSLPKGEVDKIVQETRDIHKQWLITLLRKHPLETQQRRVYLLKGEAGGLIPTLAKEMEVELIVMGTVSRTGVAGLLIGNTAEQVLRQVNCSVLTVKPEDFITPVKLDE